MLQGLLKYIFFKKKTLEKLKNSFFKKKNDME